MSGFTVPQPATFKAVRIVKIDVNVRYEEEDMPNDFPGRLDGDRWACFVELETGAWGTATHGGSVSMIPQLTHELYMKVCDEGTYSFLDDKGEVVRTIEEDYVPSFFPGEHYGDYLILNFDKGKITNWGIDPVVWRDYWMGLR